MNSLTDAAPATAEELADRLTDVTSVMETLVLKLIGDLETARALCNGQRLDDVERALAQPRNGDEVSPTDP